MDNLESDKDGCYPDWMYIGDVHKFKHREEKAAKQMEKHRGEWRE